MHLLASHLYLLCERKFTRAKELMGGLSNSVRHQVKTPSWHKRTPARHECRTGFIRNTDL